ncbi:hypothetical protein JR316_0004427 [Psilocybe cubensis]|uniref:Uncharacterized protein n=2 Tax=Psilocybe cubensis TaxID=181762 RepID=A0A8H7XY20_PSICU|nr:hypothetical protein JR316_0004427 [Psilocybe cubensis]KAH9482329.1 hypothetical protein JR316_0004427 [Psilocybe cubensis]
MRLSRSLAIFALAVGSCSADAYFSEGWKPGQQVQRETQAASATYVPQPSQTTQAGAQPPKATPFSFSSLFSIDKLLTSEPAVALFNTFGINITERVNAVVNVKLWDERVPLITDDNYQDLIVNEPLTEQEAEDRVWVLVITVTASRQEGVSKFMDEVFDDAFNQTQIAGDLPNVKWGRIDYLNVTAITTKWGIWQAPYLVILKDRGQSLRFYRPYQIRLRADALREFLKVEGWQYTKPWSSSFSPGGKNEFIMEFMAVWFTKIYNYAVRIPKWMMVMISGGVGSLIISLLHRPSVKKAEAEKAAKAKAQARASKPIAPPPKASTPVVAAEKSAPNTDSEVDASAPAPRRTSARQRKNKK